MVTKATPEDQFDFTAWLSQPALETVTVTAKSGGTRTIVVRAPSVIKYDAALDTAERAPAHRRDDRLYEALASFCIVAIVAGTEVDLDTVDTTGSRTDLDGIRKLRDGIGFPQWKKIRKAIDKAYLSTPEPDPS